MGADEYRPISHDGSNIAAAGGIGYTVVGALDSMLLMGLDAEYRRAREWVEKELSFDRDADFNTYEVRLLFDVFTLRDLSCAPGSSIHSWFEHADYGRRAWRPSFCIPPLRGRRPLLDARARSCGPHSSHIRYPIWAPAFDGKPPPAQRSFVQGERRARQHCRCVDAATRIPLPLSAHGR